MDSDKTTNRTIYPANNSDDCAKTHNSEWLPAKSICVSACRQPGVGLFKGNTPQCMMPAGSSVDDSGARSDVNRPSNYNPGVFNPGADDSVQTKATEALHATDVFYQDPTTGISIPNTVSTTTIIAIIGGILGTIFIYSSFSK